MRGTEVVCIRFKYLIDVTLSNINATYYGYVNLRHNWIGNALKQTTNLYQLINIQTEYSVLITLLVYLILLMSWDNVSKNSFEQMKDEGFGSGSVIFFQYIYIYILRWKIVYIQVCRIKLHDKVKCAWRSWIFEELGIVHQILLCGFQ